MTTLYLGLLGTNEDMGSVAAFEGKKETPSTLISFYFLKKIKESKYYPAIRKSRTMLDSGAYSASTQKKTIDINALITEIKEGKWDEAAALDVIGNPRQSLENAIKMKKAGADCFPTFHYGEPWEFLTEYAKNFDKVGLGALVPVKSKDDRHAWIAECMARIWPKKTHAFGVMSKDTLMRFPFHSVDCTSWAMHVIRFGYYDAFNEQNMGLSGKQREKLGGHTLLRPQIDHYMKMEKEVKLRWAQEFKKQGWDK